MPARIYYANGGVGDELLLTAICRAARLAGRPIHVISSYPELWRGNNDPASIQSSLERWFYAVRRQWISTEINHLSYITGQSGHIAAQMAQQIGLTLSAGWRPILANTKIQSRDSKLIVVQNACHGARYASPTKEWSQERWIELTDRLSKEYRLVQLGTSLDPVLPHAQDWRGQTTLLQAADMLSRATLFIGLESGLQHIAAALHTPAVIIYGGRSRPDETGYAFNRNISRSPVCVGCGLTDGCPNQMICMDIPVEEVESHARAAIAEALLTR